MKFKMTVPYILSGTSLLTGLNHSATGQNTPESNAPDNTFDDTPAKVITPQHNTDTVMSITELPMAINVRDTGRDVVYIYNNGAEYSRRGGTRAWRNNNPGCIRYSEFARAHGAIGRAGNFAVFPDMETGAAAIGALLKTDKYRNLTIADAITKYAPPHENDTQGYQRRLARITGLPITMKICDLNADQMTSVVNAIRILEGWRPGNEVAIKSRNNLATDTLDNDTTRMIWAQAVANRRQLSM